MRSNSPVVSLSLALCMLLSVAGCGQKPGVANQGIQGAVFDPSKGTYVDPETGEAVNIATDASGQPSSSGFAGGGSLAGGSGGGGGTTTTTATGGGGGGSTSTGGGGGGSSGGPSGGDSTGVTSKSVKIGFHAPLTGAAPVPSSSVQKGKDLYYRWLAKKGGSVKGRTVKVVLKNDQYNPSHAVAVCKEMVEEDHVFLLSGAAGTDQIVACARYAASVGVPYISAGVTEVGLEGLPNYFATSMTYTDQAPLLADYVVSKLGGKKRRNGMVFFDTPYFDDSFDAYVNAMGNMGASVSYQKKVSKNSSPQTAEQVVLEMKAKGLGNGTVFVLTSPVFFLNMLSAARRQDFHPQWVGVGISMTFDTVARVGCESGTLKGAKFFSPFPAWLDAAKYDPAYYAASEHYYGDRGDDFMWLSWAFGKIGAQLLSRPGRNLTRERFVYYATRVRNMGSGIFPPLTFSNSDRFGSSQTHVNEACVKENGRWHTIQSFASNF
jgi:branched-chain amino acid transport system substrate-binding protein